jgi:exonuclease SbcD
MNLGAAAKDAAPQATFVSVDPLCAASQVAVLERADAQGDEPDLPDLFREYLPGHVPAGAVTGDILATFTGLLADTVAETPGIFREEAELRALVGAEPGGLEEAGLLIPVQEAPGTGAREAERTQA